MTGDAMLRQIAGWLDDEIHGIDSCLERAHGLKLPEGRKDWPFLAGTYLGRLETVRDSLVSLKNVIEASENAHCHTTTYLTAGQRVVRCSRDAGHAGMHRDGAITWEGTA